MSDPVLYLGKKVTVTNGVIDVSNGSINLHVVPTLPKQAANKEYVDLQITNLIGTVDPVYLDTLGEVVDAFKTADSNINSAITLLASTASSSLIAETSRATAAELSLTTALSEDCWPQQV